MYSNLQYVTNNKSCMHMKERIIKIMETENLTPSLFADKLNIGRAVISHILNGRNNPSLDVVVRILDTIDYIDAEWLLSGKGNMRKSDNIQLSEKHVSNVMHQNTPTSLFDLDTDKITSSTSVSNATIEVAPQKETHSQNIARDLSDNKESVDNASSLTTAILATNNKKVSRVIIYFSDNSFQTFSPDSTPL